jgi:hypothetical protein
LLVERLVLNAYEELVIHKLGKKKLSGGGGGCGSEEVN